MRINRRKTRQIRVGNILIGGGAAISVQSMTKTDTRDIEATLSQIITLADAGCEIVRISVPDADAVNALKVIKKGSPVPVIADCHFDYRLALGAIRGGADGIRINPGNIGGEDKVKMIIKEARDCGIPIRIGINSGSLEKDILKKYQGTIPEALFESALRNIAIFESAGFHEIKLSLKSSDVRTTIDAYRMLSESTDYPLHLGVTEAGGPFSGAIKSAVAMGILLAEGIGDTIRVSITGDPSLEVRAGYEILRSLGLRQKGIEIISCPTCARCQIDLFKITNRVEQELVTFNKRIALLNIPFRVAIMGCVVNGPGEARDATIGIAGGRGKGVIFRAGEVLYPVEEAGLADALIAEVNKIIREFEKRKAS